MVNNFDPNLSALASFFRACPLILSLEDREWHERYLPLEGRVFVADFSIDNPTDEQIVKKGLWYLASQRNFCDIGINDAIVDEDQKSKGQVSSRDRPYPFSRYSKKNGFMWPIKITPTNPIFLKSYKPISIKGNRILRKDHRVRQEYDLSAVDLFSRWMNGEVPEDFRDLFEDDNQNLARIYAIIGAKTYKISENERVSPEIKKIVESVKDKNRKNLEKGIPIAILEEAIKIVACSSGFKRFKANFKPEEIPFRESFEVFEERERIRNRTYRILAETAYDMRSHYPRYGWEVKDGLVHRQAYRKLERLACEKGANPLIVADILQAHIRRSKLHFPYYVVTEEPEEEKITEDERLRRILYGRSYYKEERYDELRYRSVYGGFKEAFAMIGAFNILKPKMVVPEKTNEEIGRLRVRQFLEGSKPYSAEFNSMVKIMENYMSKRRFRSVVKKWIEKHLDHNLDWDVIDKAIPPNKKRLRGVNRGVNSWHPYFPNFCMNEQLNRCLDGVYLE